MLIRHAVPADLEALSTIETASYPPKEGASKESIASRLAVFADHFWILEEDGQILAFINGMVTDQPDLTDDLYDHAALHKPDGAWQMIFSVVTAPAHRHKGCAAQVMQEVIRDARAAQRRGIVLTCKERLLDFYAQFGFRNEGVSVSTHGDVTWYQMRLTF